MSFKSKFSKTHILIKKIIYYPEKIKLKEEYNKLTILQRNKFKLLGTNLLKNNIYYSQTFYRLFVSKIYNIPTEIQLLICSYICPESQINKMIYLPKKQKTIDILNTIHNIF